MTKIEITKEPIELNKLLKFESIVASGGEAKQLISAGRVVVNGMVEKKIRKQLQHGDTVEVGGEKYLVMLVEA